jgi:hypothetical protein
MRGLQRSETYFVGDDFDEYKLLRRGRRSYTIAPFLKERKVKIIVKINLKDMQHEPWFPL